MVRWCVSQNKDTYVEENILFAFVWHVASSFLSHVGVYLLDQNEDITNNDQQGLEKWQRAIFNSLGGTVFLSFGTPKFVWSGRRCMFLLVCSVAKAAFNIISSNFIAVTLKKT